MVFANLGYATVAAGPRILHANTLTPNDYSVIE